MNRAARAVLAIPGYASVDELKLWPGTILQTSEMDMIRDGSKLFLPKLKKRACIWITLIMRETDHGCTSAFEHPLFERACKEWKRALKSWGEVYGAFKAVPWDVCVHMDA